MSTAYNRKVRARPKGKGPRNSDAADALCVRGMGRVGYMNARKPHRGRLKEKGGADARD